MEVEIRFRVLVSRVHVYGYDDIKSDLPFQDLDVKERKKVRKDEMREVGAETERREGGRKEEGREELFSSYQSYYCYLPFL